MEKLSKRFVFLPEVDESSWLLWTQVEARVGLRKFSESEGEPTYHDFSKLKPFHDAAVESGHVYELTDISDLNVKTNPKFWFDFQQILNGCSGLIEVDIDTLQAIFKEQFTSRVCEGSWKEVRALTHLWITAMACAEEREEQLSDYDLKPFGTFPENHGKNWQSRMLDYSRKERRFNFVDTPPYDACKFSFAVTELGISVSKTKKVLGMEARKLIQPDGLGVRKNGSLTVLEVKAPGDEHELLPPVLQAACAATGIVAKRNMICNALKAGHGIRPKYPDANLEHGVPSIGLHVLTAKTGRSKNKQLEQWSDDIESQCQTLLKGFKELEYIAFSFVDPDETEDFSVIKIDKLVRE